jgi:uncharacterized YccA/Bax inhibitor family protein
MTNKHAGYILGLASVGMMLVLISSDIKQLNSFSDAWTPAFIGTATAHLGNVIMAFIGGKLIPTEPQNQRIEDKILREINNDKKS